MVVMNARLLDADEYPFGYYKVQRVEWNQGEWSETGYWLNAVVTNHRLIISPAFDEQTPTRDVFRPLDIRKVWNVSLKGRDGIMIARRDGKRLYMLVDWSQGNKLVKDLNEMLAPPIRPRIMPRLMTT
jgi:hypothetical protein